MRIAWLALAVTACGSPPPPSPPAPPAAAPVAAQPPAPVAPPPASPYPAAERHPVTDSYGDVKVVDDYRWLEDGKAPAVIAWTAAENQLTRSRLDALPDRPKIRARVAELLSNHAPSYHRVAAAGRGVLALERHPPKQQELLVAFADPGNAATKRVVLDANELDPSGKTAIDWFAASRDGKRVGVSLSSGGSESGDVHVYDVATGKPLPDVVPRVNGGTAGGSMAWNADGTGFWYTRYPGAGERPAEDLDFYQQIYFHKLGTPVASDVYVLGKDFPRIAEVQLRTSPDGKSVLATVGNGDGGEFALHVIEARGDGRGKSVQVSQFTDKIVRGAFGPDGTLYMISHQGAPKGAVLRLRRPYTGTPEPIVPEGDGVIEELAVTASRLYLRELVGGPSRLRAIRLLGKAPAPEAVATPLPIASISGLEPYGRDDLLYTTESYVATPGWYRYAPATGTSTATALVQPMPFAMDDVEVVRDTCMSADGTAVPINILYRRGLALDGSHPALLTGYGGYRISMTPVLSSMSRLWLDQGGVWAIANLRGGNEFGQAWNEAGRLTQKQHVFDDFYACARALVDKRYTRPERLAITGRSNGGLLMGAALTQHPEMYRAVVSGVGIYDSLRFELTANGTFNIPEFGTVKDPAQFRALYAYSPYHHVKDGVAYPAILMTTGANDPRVDPYNSRKMTARMQAANPAGHPVLLRATGDVGHGMGSPLHARIEEDADSFAFLMHELGMHYTE